MEKIVAFLMELFGGKVAVQLYQEKQGQKDKTEKSKQVGSKLVEFLASKLPGKDVRKILEDPSAADELIRVLGNGTGLLTRENILQLLRGHIGIYDNVEVIKEFEGKFPNLRQVWVSSRKFLDSEELFQTVRNNILSRNVSYKYFLSWEENSLERLTRFFKRMLDESTTEEERAKAKLLLKDSVYIYLINPHLVDNDFFIMNPLVMERNNEETSRLCFTKMELLSGFQGFGIESTDILKRRVTRLSRIVEVAQENNSNIIVVDSFANVGKLKNDMVGVDFRRFAVPEVETPTAIVREIPLLENFKVVEK